MALDYDRLMSLPPIETRQTYGVRDVQLYALGVGAGLDDLDLVYEDDLKTLPSMAVVLGYPGFWQKEPQYGLDWRRILHGEQSVRLHSPLPNEGTVISRLTIDAIHDKGADKGALLYSTRNIVCETTGVHLATVSQSSFLRGDGGYNGPDNQPPPPTPHTVPNRPPDLAIDLQTRPEQALIYRLSGDYNPLHIDPEIARAAGFDRPILHGLCTFGVATRALIRALCPRRPDHLIRQDVRFSSPVYPGETLRTEIWRGDGYTTFRVRSLERDLIVLNNGYAEVA